MDTKLIVIVNWCDILANLKEHKYIDQLKRRMKECLKTNLKHFVPKAKILLKFEDSIKVKYIEYKIEKYPPANLNLMYSAQKIIVGIVVKAFMDYDVPAIYHSFIEDMGIINQNS